MFPSRFACLLILLVIGTGAGDVAAAEQPDSAAQKTQDVEAGPLTLQVPTTWEREEPSNRLRLAQFSIPPVEGDREKAELVLSGPFGGSARENVQRWIDQFEPEERELKMTQGETDDGKYIFVELAGTYNMTIGPPIRRQTRAMPGYRVLNVMLMTETGGNFFFKLAGPDATVKAATDSFRKSFGADAARETEYTLE